MPSSLSIDITIAIPTYNGAKRFPDVLERLREQVISTSINWEILVVDNNSTDDTAAIIQAYQSELPQLRYCFEPKQGAAFARKLAFQEARGTLIGFLDDDNLPAQNWVAAAYDFAQEHPLAGAYGSQIHGLFEVEPSESFQRLLPFLAITERGSIPLRYEPRQRVLPPSAGLVVRKQAWFDVPSQLTLTGRTSSNMLTGEDLEMLAYIQRAGWEIWYNPAMEVEHKIPAWRLQKEYLIPFFRGVGLSRYVTRMVGVQPQLKPIATLAYAANDLRKITIHLLKHRLQFKSDLSTACELELFINSFISPLYLWKNGYLKNKNLIK